MILREGSSPQGQDGAAGLMRSTPSPAPEGRALCVSGCVAALFCRSDSVYKSMPGVDVFDLERDALTWSGGSPVVAHPPCRAWSRLRHFARPRPGERELALWAVAQVRQFGGVLEHPSGSELFRHLGLPVPGSTARDAFGGFVLPVSQKWWGHRAEKRTWLYVVGVDPCALPGFPLVLGRAECVIGSRAGREVSKAEREATPPAFAQWLVDLARSAQVSP